jgi:hypothetical protein
MGNFKINSKITITRLGRERKANFFVSFQNTINKVPAAKTAGTIQDLLASLEKIYETTLYADDYSYNFKLRKDEYIPREALRADLIRCSVEDCKKVAIFHLDDGNFCKMHFFESEKTLPVIRAIDKQQRNEKCNCGSNLKYKNCCIKNVEVHSGRLHYNPKDKKNIKQLSDKY